MIKITFKKASRDTRSVKALHKTLENQMLKQPVRSIVTFNSALDEAYVRIDSRIYKKGFVDEELAIAIAQLIGMAGLEGYDLEIVTDKLESPF